MRTPEPCWGLGSSPSPSTHVSPTPSLTTSAATTGTIGHLSKTPTPSSVSHRPKTQRKQAPTRHAQSARASRHDLDPRARPAVVLVGGDGCQRDRARAGPRTHIINKPQSVVRSVRQRNAEAISAPTRRRFHRSQNVSPGQYQYRPGAVVLSLWLVDE